MLSRRELLAAGLGAGAAAALLPACARGSRRAGAPQAGEPGEWVDDVHARLNRTHVLGVERPDSLERLQDVVWRAARDGRALSI
ncbi:MAG TPA: hypothetical protein VFD43_05665 [Planctomycetota bacterium]|nr:hypothetical protein [Planctomycetota bacterium]